MGVNPMKLIRDRLMAKEEQLRIILSEIDLLKSLLAEATGEPIPTALKTKAPRSNVKVLILELLEEAGHSGINAALAVELAKAKGQTLERASASSILSRLKADGVVTYTGDRYRLSQYEIGVTNNIHPHPSSKVYG